jgi:hypothetical protein
MRDLESGDGLAFKLDSDGADLLRAVDAEYHAPRDLVKVGIELGLVVQGDADGHCG